MESYPPVERITVRMIRTSFHARRMSGTLKGEAILRKDIKRNAHQHKKKNKSVVLDKDLDITLRHMRKFLMIIYTIII